MAAHSRFGGSKADIWMHCAGSVALAATVPARVSSKYADEGKAAHALAEVCLKENLHPRHFLSSPLEGHPDFEVTQEMCDAVVVYLNAVTHEQAKSKDAELYVEKSFALDIPGIPAGEVFGTNDAMVYHPSKKRLVVFDYKHGAGVSVTAEDNAQLQFYAAGAVFGNPDWRVAELELVIIQPRARDIEKPEDAIRAWPIEVVDLMGFLDDAGNAILRAKHAENDPGPDAKDLRYAVIEEGGKRGESWPRYKVGSWCRWCEAAAVCPAREVAILDAAQLDFADMTEITADALPGPKTLDTARLGQILAAQKLLDAWFSQCMETVEGLLLSGTPVEGWKVVDKIGRAKWRESDEEVVDVLSMLYDIDEDMVRPRKLTTITEVEKMLKAAGATKEQIDDFKLRYTIKDSAGLTIAAASDRRPAVDAVKQDFGDVKI